MKEMENFVSKKTVKAHFISVKIRFFKINKRAFFWEICEISSKIEIEVQHALQCQ